MTVPLAVIDPMPVYRYGIAAILANHGVEVHTPTDVVAWARDRRRSLVLLSVLSADDWDLLGTLCRSRPRPLVIAVTADDSAGSGARAVRLGARSVLSRQATVRAVERAVAATIEGEAIMPAAVASALSATRQPVTASQVGLSGEQIAWLRSLSAGRTMAALAKEAGYSERAMYRLLRAVYEQLGVRTRLEAIVRMQEAGWLAGDVSEADSPDMAG
ncbi:DNA-binding response regulator [Phytohabitans sp. LJ34]|uniref:DNA-binding response regulator n=1 Tax=Phytohabitans sp. LJ34 TaxID=3452217 RepID=UPI003F89C585